MLSKLLIIAALSCLVGTPVLAAVGDVDAAHTDGTTDVRPDDQKADDASVVTRESKVSKDSEKTKAGNIAVERDNKSNTSSMTKNANNAMDDALSGLRNKQAAPMNAVPRQDTSNAALAKVYLTEAGVSGGKEDALNDQVLKGTNGDLMAQNLIQLAPALAKIKNDPTIKGRVRRAVIAFRARLAAMRTIHSSASVDSLNDAVTTLATSVALDHWSDIQLQFTADAAKNPNSNASEQARLYNAAIEVIQRLKPTWKDDVVKEVARQIVYQHDCV